jgi:thiosulfate/3-mercaptopyruvate sulfurtransferase
MPRSTIPAGFRPDLPRWRQLVSPAALAGLLRAPSATLLIEVGCGVLAQFEDHHIPGASYLDTSELEHGPHWNRLPDAQLLACLLARGIRHDSTVILYGRNNLAAARAAHLLLYAGVLDVRLLDGGYHAWRRAGLPLVAGRAPPARPVATFGAAFPGCPAFMVDLAQARAMLADASATLVSIRSWSEYVGTTSGYSYMPVRGDIPGARWGRAGVDGDVNSMSAFHDDEGAMKPAAAIAAMWQGAGISAGQHAVFYCGTGWRASQAFFYAWLMGWPRLAVFDGGWCEWSAHADNPVRLGAAD